jgi:hypothetical protein
MSVQEYLEKHKLSSRIEDAVNAAVRAKSPDPVIFIVSLPHLVCQLCFHFMARWHFVMFCFFWGRISVVGLHVNVGWRRGIPRWQRSDDYVVFEFLP